MPEDPMTQQGVARGVGHAVLSRGSPLCRLGPYFLRKKDIFSDKNPLKISARSELRISGYLGNGERPEKRDVKQKRNGEREIQSRRGSSPPGAMAAIDQRGNSPPI